MNFSDPEGYIDSSDDPPLPDGTFLHCTYTVTVYTGYGVELQVSTYSHDFVVGVVLTEPGSGLRMNSASEWQLSVLLALPDTSYFCSKTLSGDPLQGPDPSGWDSLD